jgi:hypothetical protein
MLSKLLIIALIMDFSTSKYGFNLTKKNGDIYLETTESEHKFTLIWMHGLGDSANGFLDFFYSRNSVVPNKVRIE